MTLSVIVPNYNHAHYLPESLGAILGQSWPATEVIVIDDASTDNSLEVLEGFQKTYPTLKIIRHETNQGVEAACNHGLEVAQGEYIGMYAADDIIGSGLFENCMTLLKEFPELGACWADSSYFVDKKPYHFRDIHMVPGRNTPHVLSPEEYIETCRKYRYFSLITHTAIYRRELMLKYRHRRELKNRSDFFTNQQIALRYPTGFIPKVLGSFREVEGSYGALTNKNAEQRNTAFQNLMEAVEKEGEEFVRKFKYSGLLFFGGIFVIPFLLRHPKYWGYLPTVLKKKLPDIPRLLVKHLRRLINNLQRFKVAYSK